MNRPTTPGESAGRTLDMHRRLVDRIGAGAWGRADGAAEAIGGGVDYAVELLGYETVSSAGIHGALGASAGVTEPMVLVRAADGTRELLVAGTAMDPGGAGSAARAASAWRERWFRLWKRSELPGKLIAFFGELSAASTPEEVSAVVSDHAMEMVGAYKAVVFLPDPAATDAPAEGASILATRMGRAGLMVAPDFREVAEPWWRELGAFLGDPEVAMVAHVPFGDRGVLLVAERRSDRVFDSDDWEVLRTVAEQGDRALARVRELENAFELSLTDALTGLANRRQMDVVLKHAWAAAERGDALAVMMLDLDEFKKLNDGFGHAFGDQILTIAARCLQEEARGADAVVRYGGDEFLVVLPRGTAEGARSLAGRVQARLEGWVGVSAGVAEYHASYVSPADLIHAADEDLYRNKARRLLGMGDEAVADRH